MKDCLSLKNLLKDNLNKKNYVQYINTLAQEVNLTLQQLLLQTEKKNNV